MLAQQFEETLVSDGSNGRRYSLAATARWKFCGVRHSLTTVFLTALCGLYNENQRDEANRYRINLAPPARDRPR